MNPIFRKDLRENLRIALLGLAIFTLVIVLDFHSGRVLLYNITHGQANGDESALQPLLYGGFINAAVFFCAIFGAALGFFQARNEAHRDLWAFLIHRPITRTQIFYGKTAAGLCLYFIGAGLPILVLISYVAAPGDVAAPFEPAMILPAFGVFLTGLVYYFAGMLTGLRQARWFGSRVFGLGVGIAGSIAIYLMPEFWQVLAVVGLLLACVGVAAWGAYQSGGFYRGQPHAGKVALTFSLGFGSFAVVVLAVGLGETLLSGRESMRWQNYVMMHDGKMCVQTTQDGAETFSDLDGKPLINHDTGKAFTAQEFNRLRTPALSASSGGRRYFWLMGHYREGSAFFSLWNVSGKTLWYLDRHGKLVGFNGITRRHVGDIVAHDASGEEPFLTRKDWDSYNYFNNWNPPSVLCTASTAYGVNLDDRKLTPLFTTSLGDPIIGFGQDNFSKRFVVLTSSTVRVLNMTGKSLLSLPYLPAPDTYRQIGISMLDASLTNRFAVWFHPDYLANSELNWKLPIHVAWVTADNQVTQTRDLPTLTTPEDDSLSDSVLEALVAPPAVFLSFKLNSKSEQWLPLVSIPLFGLIGCVLVRRHRFSAVSAIAWTLFIGLFALPGLLTFFCVQEFPRREACPNCKKLRAVDRDQCEHCAAEFPPPDKIGIEIFEPITSP